MFKYRIQSDLLNFYRSKPKFRRIDSSQIRFIESIISPKLQTEKSQLITPIGIQKIITVNTKRRLKYAIEKLSTISAVGFDSESKPIFTHYLSPSFTQSLKLRAVTPHLIQLSTENEAFLFSTLHYAEINSSVHRFLKEYLQNEKYLKVGFDLKSDNEKLQNNYSITPKGIIDLSVLLATKKGQPMGLVRAVNQYLSLDYKKTKRLQLSNWSLEFKRLSQNSIRYAANDAYLALHVYLEWQRQKTQPKEPKEQSEVATTVSVESILVEIQSMLPLS
jgi:ribonuclease D